MAGRSKVMTHMDPAQLLLDLEKENFSMRIQKSSGLSVKNSRFSEIRRGIARLKCVMRKTGGQHG